MEHKHKAPVLPCWTSEQGVCTTVTNSALRNEATEEMRRRASVTCDTSWLSATQRNDLITKAADSIRKAPGAVRYHRHNYTRLVISFLTKSTGWPICARRFSLQNYTQDVHNVLFTWQLAWMLAEYIGLDNKMLHYVSCRLLTVYYTVFQMKLYIYHLTQQNQSPKGNNMLHFYKSPSGYDIYNVIRTAIK